MTSEQKVKQVYPKARLVKPFWNGSGYHRCAEIHTGPSSIVYLGRSEYPIESWAWADAWRSIKKEQKEKLCTKIG